MECLPRWSSLWMVIPSVSALQFDPVTPPLGILFPLLRRTKVNTLVFLLLGLLVVYELYLVYSELLV